MTLTGEFDEQSFLNIAAAAPDKAGQFMLYSKLRVYYCEKYLQDKTLPIPNVEQLINDYFNEENRLNYFTFLTERMIFNRYTESEYRYFTNLYKRNTSDQSHTKQFWQSMQYAANLYEGLTLYINGCTSPNEYGKCADMILAAMTFCSGTDKNNPSDSSKIQTILDECLQKSHRYEPLFMRTAYRMFDRDDDGLWNKAQLWLLYKKIHHPSKSFAELCSDVRQHVLSTAISAFVPTEKRVLSEINLINVSAQNEIIRLDDTNYSGTVILFFNVTCHHCIDEMDILTQMSSTLQQQGIRIIGIYTMMNDVVTAASELKEFSTRHKYNFPLYIDTNKNDISKSLGINAVPTMMLCQGDGTIAGIGSFKYYGHLKEKLETTVNIIIEK